MDLSPADRAAIADLLADYCRHLDAMDLPALAALFTPEAAVTYGDAPALNAAGRAAIEASLARMWRWRRTAHHLTTLRLWADGPDTARSEARVIAWHERGDGRTATVHGRYLDRLVRGADGWRIAHRRMEELGSDAGFTVPLHPAPRAAPPPGWSAPAGLDP
ncbi:MAG: nuclear transport factor 2 family protein [Rhodobacteraceae bacterium]|jgi:ketosteroid isomerase-like protein|nr:nuclear transport factor 2 family protein [Paracoccaceae bacterium]